MPLRPLLGFATYFFELKLFQQNPFLKYENWLEMWLGVVEHILCETLGWIADTMHTQKYEENHRSQRYMCEYKQKDRNSESVILGI